MLSIIFSLWISLFPLQDINEMQQMFYVQQQAINTNNLPKYLSTLYSDQHYKQEQKRWFKDAVSFIDPKSFHIKIKSYHFLSKGRYHVEIFQSYRKNHQLYTFIRPVEVIKTKQGWRDADSLAYERKKGSITIKYTDPKFLDQAERSLGILSHVSELMAHKYLWRPRNIEVKLYRDPEVFRQSVKLSLPTWAGGWNEAKQSIKLIIGETDVASLTHGLAHEYTHQLLSDMTNDNAAYWLQEGAAMFYEALVSKERPFKDENFHPYTIEQLERLNLEQLPDEAASQYYVSCFIRFKELVHQYGEKRIAKAFRELRQYPYIDEDSAMKQQETNERTDHVFQKNKLIPSNISELKDTYINWNVREIL
jgi:hypothetical protein